MKRQARRLVELGLMTWILTKASTERALQQRFPKMKANELIQAWCCCCCQEREVDFICALMILPICYFVLAEEEVCLVKKLSERVVVPNG